MTILPLVVGDLHTNCYLAIDESTNKCLVIDPADEGDFISTTIIEEKLTPVGIVLTHGHYDHCLAALELKLNFDIPIYLHKADLFLYKNAAKSANFWSPSLRDSYSNRGNPGIRHSGLGHAKVLGTRGETIKIIPLPPIDHFLDDGQIIPFGDSSLTVIHTPGHTPGSICLVTSLPCQGKVSEGRKGSKQRELHLFTGDTLFADGVGRTDLSYSSKSDLKKSLQVISELPGDTLIYPGHEEYEVPFDKNRYANPK